MAHYQLAPCHTAAATRHAWSHVPGSTRQAAAPVAATPGWRGVATSSTSQQRQHCMHASQRQQPHSSSRGSIAAAATAGSNPRGGTAVAQTSPAGSVDPVYLAAAAYLAELGFRSKTEIARVLDIAMNPRSLFVTASANANARPLDVEGDIRPVVAFLQQQGITSGDLVKVISAHPPVLSYDVAGRLAPFWEYLSGVGVADVGAAVVGRPSLLGLDVDANLRKIVDYLIYVGTEPAKIVEYICKSL